MDYALERQWEDSTVDNLIFAQWYPYQTFSAENCKTININGVKMLSLWYFVSAAIWS